MGFLVPIISSAVIGLLKNIGWMSLIEAFAVDGQRCLAKHVKYEFIKDVLTDSANAIESGGAAIKPASDKEKPQ